MSDQNHSANNSHNPGHINRSFSRECTRTTRCTCSRLTRLSAMKFPKTLAVYYRGGCRRNIHRLFFTTRPALWLLSRRVHHCHGQSESEKVRWFHLFGYFFSLGLKGKYREAGLLLAVLNVSRAVYGFNKSREGEPPTFINHTCTLPPMTTIILQATGVSAR